MIRFVDIDNGNVFNGDKPYVFWMDNQQSTQMIYVKRICILSDLMYLHLTIPVNDVFQYIDVAHIEELDDVQINDFKYKDINEMRTYELYSTGVNYRGLYVHMVYIAAQSENIGEFHESFFIEDNEYEIAADFYEQNEVLKINLANFGEEIPESIQGAIYDSNVHEESKDNITINRKFKELLLNYWNIVAARGSYRSLLDSLSWFEYGDLVTINEIWKHKEWGLDRMNREELNLIMTENIRKTLANFSKTTYIGLYLALQKYVTQDGEVQYDKLNNIVVEETVDDVDILSAQTDRLIPNNDPDKDWLFTINEEDISIDEYGERDDVVGPGSNWIRNNNVDYEGFIGEEVPLLKNKLFKWSVEDLSLKMYLLGSFYEAYFMPIHLDLLHSTIESLVFTNTIKCMNTTNMDRLDYVLNTEAFHCNIPDGATYKMQDVNVQAGSMLRRHWDDSSDDSSDDYYETAMSNTYRTDNYYGPAKYVDLGLPSGTLWAKWNLGATSETDYGDYYAWGEIETKNTYTKNNYKFGSSSSFDSNVPFEKYNLGELEVLEYEDDAAYVLTQGEYRIPSADEAYELFSTDTLTNQWVTNYQGSGVNGALFTSLVNGETLFIPAAGNKTGINPGGRGTYCLLWTDSLKTGGTNSTNAFQIYSDSSQRFVGNNWRYIGQSIRPVKNKDYDPSDSDDYDKIPIFGVEDEYDYPMKLEGEDSDDTIVNDRLKTFMLNNYNGIGVVIPFHCEIPAEKDDFINCERALIFTEDGLKDRVLEKHALYKETDGKFIVDFNLLLTDEGENVVTLYFSTAGGRQYIKSLHINLLGDVSCRLKMYKVKSSNSLQGLNAEDYDLSCLVDYSREFRENYIRPFNNYIFSHTRYEHSLRNQTVESLHEQGYNTIPGYNKLFITGTDVNTAEDNGVKYNHVIIFDADFLNEATEDEIETLTSRIDLFNVGLRDTSLITPGGKKYYTLVSKSFYGTSYEMDESIKSVVNVLRYAGETEKKNYILRYNLGFFFQHHYLESLGVNVDDSGKYSYGLSLDDYTITDKDTLCVVPEMKYSNIQLKDTEWIFKNVSGKEVIHLTSSKEPFIGNDLKEKLKPGYYNVTFRYKIGDTWGETTLDSAFRKV